MIRTLLAALLLSTTAHSAIAGEAVTYKVAGADYEGYWEESEQPAKGLVLIVHDWDGLTEYEEKRAAMLAKLGYDAFAVDLYGKGNRPVETGAKKAETGKLYNDREAMRQRLLAGLAEALKKSTAQETIVMGYCFGGSATLELARSGLAGNVVGFASFHGGLKTPKGQSYSKDTPPLLIAHGGADSSITLDDVATLGKELEAAGTTYTIEVYSGAPHAFTVFGSDRYQERADRLSWDAFTSFMASVLK